MKLTIARGLKEAVARRVDHKNVSDVLLVRLKSVDFCNCYLTEYHCWKQVDLRCILAVHLNVVLKFALIIRTPAVLSAHSI